MRLDQAIDAFIADWRARGRMRSQHTELAYRRVLERHATDVANRDPSKTGRSDVKRTLGHWDPPSSSATRNHAHAILRSFYDWAMQEELRRDNPARQILKAKHEEAQAYRMTRAETIALLEASKRDRRDRWTAHLGVLAGLRSQELRGLQGRHLMRDGWVWISADIGKGAKERWVPVVAELQPIVAEIRTLITSPDHHVLPGRRSARPPGAAVMVDATVAQSASALYNRVVKLGRKAGIPGRVTPHTMRHAFGDLLARDAGPKAAQDAMGHANVQTTFGTYMDHLSLDELALAFSGLRVDRPQLPVSDHPHKPSARP